MTTPIQADPTPSPASPERRDFLGGLGRSASLALLAPALSLTGCTATEPTPAAPPNAPKPPSAPAPLTDATPANNGDEARYSDFRASYTKGLPHGKDGFVDADTYRLLLDAVKTGNQAAFEALPMGGKLKLANPLAAFALDPIGANPQTGRLIAPPAYASRNTALDLIELYWMALCRDVPFANYGGNALIAEAATDLNRLGWYEEFGFEVTPQTIFRSQYKGATAGPYLSQFLYLPVPLGPTQLPQRNRTAKASQDYMTDPASWLDITQGSIDPTGKDAFEPDSYYIRNLRDGTAWVHVDQPYQAPAYAAHMLWSWGKDYWSDANPYKKMVRHSAPFTTWGLPDILSLIGLATNCALRFAWYQKWCVHRRVRPEVFAQRLHRAKSEGVDLGIHPAAMQSSALDRIFEHNRLQNLKLGRGIHGSYLLPQAYPEGCPAHPAYPAGHAIAIAAGVTVCKAFFDEDAFIPTPKAPNEDGTELVAHGQPLSVGSELNKLIGNVSLLRNAAGVHWRTDGAFNPLTGFDTRWGGNVLGEEVALEMLKNIRANYRESFPAPFRLTRLDGSTVEI